MLLFAFLLAAQNAPAPGPVKLFSDWVVACDNGHRCEMTSLLPGDMPAPDEDAGYDVTVSVERLAGPAGAYTLEVAAYHDLKGRVTLEIDDTAIATTDATSETVTFTGSDAAKAVAAMANGKGISLVDGAGKPVARASLAGSSAALRYMDADQGRAGTVTAAVARGAGPASTVPAAPAPLRIAAVQPAGAPATVSKALRAALGKQAQCDDMYEPGNVPDIAAHALGGGKTLLLIPCGSGAYNFLSAAFILSGGKAVPAPFDLEPGESDGAMLVNADFDKGVLSSFAKGRGIGDCGEAKSYVWDGSRFRLIEARSMDECRGSINWLTTWRATPVFH